MIVGLSHMLCVESKLGKHDKNDHKTSSDARSIELDIFRLNGRGIGKKEVHILPSFLMKKAKWFIFNNCQEAQPYLEYRSEQKVMSFCNVRVLREFVQKWYIVPENIKLDIWNGIFVLGPERVSCAA
ncbi:hypothetical protein L1987_87892 [Smallanthus sonchifolius]|nr:hypothetical protein L1987_87892 [Smallanthus sonchifolius]